jgi:hypothetical protein
MANILGESGRYVSDEAVRQKRQIIITALFLHRAVRRGVITGMAATKLAVML